MWHKIKKRLTRKGDQNFFIICRYTRYRGKYQWVFFRWVKKYSASEKMYHHGY